MLYGPRSAVWDEAENRLHSQKALLALDRPVTDFEAEVRAALDSLPPGIARALDNVTVVIEDENPADPDLLGLYEGVPLPERGQSYAGQLPDRIAIYRVPLEESFDDPAELRAGDPCHRSARAGALLRHRRGSARAARIRLTSRW